MAELRPAEAARVVGKDSATIYRAMRRGGLSYTMSADGHRIIDSTELERVFGSFPPAALAAWQRAQGMPQSATVGAPDVQRAAMPHVEGSGREDAEIPPISGGG